MNLYRSCTFGLAFFALLSGVGLCRDDNGSVSAGQTEEPATVVAAPEGGSEATATTVEAQPKSPADDDIVPNGRLDNDDITDAQSAVEQLKRSLNGRSVFDIKDVANAFTLQSSIDTAMEMSPVIRAVDEKIVQATAQYEQYQSQKNLHFKVSNTTTYQNRQVSAGMVVLDPLSDRLTASLQLLLSTFGKVENSIAAAYINIGVEQLNAMSTRNEVRHEVKKAFFNRLKAESSVDVSNLNLDLTQQSLADAKKMYAQGVMALYDVVQADLQVTEAEEQLARSNTSVVEATASLLKLLGVRDLESNAYTFIAPRGIKVDPACTLEELQRLAESRRFEILSFDRSIEVLEKTRKSVEAENRPEVYLSGDYIFSPGYHSMPCSIYQLNLNINWSAWDGGNRKAKLDEVDSQIAEIKHSRDDLVDTIRLSVEKAWQEFNLTDVTMRTAAKRVEAAWIFHDMARQRFLNGLGTSLEVQTALTSLNEARQAYVVACYDRDLAFADLEYCVGVDFSERYLTVPAELFNVE